MFVFLMLGPTIAKDMTTKDQQLPAKQVSLQISRCIPTSCPPMRLSTHIILNHFGVSFLGCEQRNSYPKVDELIPVTMASGVTSYTLAVGVPSSKREPPTPRGLLRSQLFRHDTSRQWPPVACSTKQRRTWVCHRCQ